MYSLKIKKTIFLSLIASTLLYGNTKSEAEIFFDGFVAAKKAIERDYALQGSTNELIPTKRFIVYADVSKMSDNKKLMIQLLGINNSLRTTDQWIIFSSFNTRPNAEEELMFLNNKYFKNKNDINVEIFENTQNKEFHRAHFIFKDSFTVIKEDLKNEITKEVKTTLEDKYQKEIDKKKKELEENQKIAVVYLDNEKQKTKNVSQIQSTLKKEVKTTPTPKPFFIDNKKETKPTKSLTQQQKINALIKKLKTSDTTCIDETRFKYKDKEYTVGDTIDGIVIEGFRKDIDEEYEKFKIKLKGDKPNQEHIIGSMKIIKEEKPAPQLKKEVKTTPAPQAQSIQVQESSPTPQPATTRPTQTTQVQTVAAPVVAEQIPQPPQKEALLYKSKRVAPVFELQGKVILNTIDSKEINLLPKEMKPDQLIQVDSIISDENRNQYIKIANSNLLMYLDDASFVE